MSHFFLRCLSILMLCLSLQIPTSIANEIQSEHQYSGKVALGGLSTTGNTTIETFDALLELNYSYQSWVIESSFKGEQTSDNATLTSDYYEANLKTAYNFAWQSYAFALLNYREDFFSGIYRENSKLLGLGYHVFTTDKPYILDLEVGTGTRETQKVNKTKLDVDPITHGAIMMAYQATEHDKVTAQIIIEDGNDDSFIKKTLTWQHVLFKAFELDFAYESRTLTAPAFGKTGTDTSTSLKLGYAF